MHSTNYIEIDFPCDKIIQIKKIQLIEKYSVTKTLKCSKIFERSKIIYYQKSDSFPQKIIE